MKKIKYLALGLITTTVLTIGLSSCDNDNTTLENNSDEKSVISAKNTQLKYAEETDTFINTFYNGGDYEIVNTEIINDDYDSYEVKYIMYNGNVRGHLITIISENKVIFADKNNETKIMTLFDGDFGEAISADFSEISTIEIEDLPEGDDNMQTFGWRFKGIGGKFFGPGKDCGPEREQIGLGCTKSCEDTYSILFLKFGKGNGHLEGC